MKWIYTYVLFFVMMAWAVFVVLIVHHTLHHPDEIDIIAVSGTSIVLGALIAKWSDTHQFWFRKSAPKQNSQ